MTKLLLMPVLMATACLVSGLFGALHNQISYTVSLEYFTHFKFRQFSIHPEIPERLGAALVGWYAAWWMGIVIGVVLIPIGLIIPSARNYFRTMLRAFAVVAGTTLTVGLSALTIATLAGSSDLGTSWTGQDDEVARAFQRAGTMHNFSYLGGLAGVLTGILTILVERGRLREAPQDHPD